MNRTARNQLVKIYGEKCWLNYRLSRDNRLTYHHIKLRRERGKADIENGALLSEQAQRDLHSIENRKEFELINRLLQLYKHTGYTDILYYCRTLLDNALAEKPFCLEEYNEKRL